MESDIIIIIAEDDDGHAALVERNIKRSGVINPIVRFRNGQEVYDFLFQENGENTRDKDASYLLLLDIRMPKMTGIELLQFIKSDPELKKMPVIMVTTTDDPHEVRRCHELGCNIYIQKPVDYDKFVKAIQQLGIFLKVVVVPRLDTENE